MDDPRSRLVLGTVQFGMPYGIANQSGQVPAAEVGAILSLARKAGIRALDTAVAYRDAESRLGEADVGGFDVITKLPPVPAACTDPEAWVEDTVNESLSRLGCSRLYGLLLHRSRDLLEDSGSAIQRALLRLRAAGRVAKIGVSIYDPQELDALEARFAPDLVQAPFNVIDRRLETSGWLTRLQAAGVEVHARSIFLQGLLLMPGAARPARFSAWRELFARWDAWLEQEGVSALRACLSFALSRGSLNGIVVGVDSRAQLEQIIAAANSGAVAPADVASDDADLINPARWSAA